MNKIERGLVFLALFCILSAKTEDMDLTTTQVIVYGGTLLGLIVATVFAWSGLSKPKGTP